MASQEFLKREFVHYLSDTLALLGAGDDLVNKIRQVEEKPLTPQIIDEIRGFNCRMIDNLKGRMDIIHKLEINVAD